MRDEPAIPALEREQVVGQQPMTGLQKRGRETRFPSPAIAHERHRPSIDHDSSCVERLDSELEHRVGQHLSEKIRVKGLDRCVVKRSANHATPVGRHEELK